MLELTLDEKVTILLALVDSLEKRPEQKQQILDLIVKVGQTPPK